MMFFAYVWGIVFWVIVLYYWLIKVKYRIAIYDYLGGTIYYITAIDGITNEYYYSTDPSQAMIFKDIDRAVSIVSHFGDNDNTNMVIEKRVFGKYYIKL
uniref:hypothetical protein n=1 Tax=Streptococcus pluranimalium TaxID=82348 RepID=UPI003F6911A6